MPVTRHRVQTVNDGESLTVQSEARQADIRQIIRRYAEVGILDHLKEVELRYADVSEFTDLGDALRQAKAAEQQFLKLPSKVRELFNHDVAEWLDTAHDQDKQDALKPRLQALGVLPADAGPAPAGGNGNPAGDPPAAGQAGSSAS